MNITPLQLYFITRLDDIRDFLFCIGFGCFLSIIAVGLITLCEDPSNNRYETFIKKTKPWIIRFIVGVFISGCLSVATPTTKQMAIVVVLPKIINNEKVQGIPEKVLGLANDWLEELKPNGKGK